MTELIRQRLQHALPAFLLSVGLAMPLCGALDKTIVSPRLILFIAGTILAFELASLHRMTAWTAFFLSAAALTVWICAGNGRQVLFDAAAAAGLRMKGLQTAVPLAAVPVSVITSVGIANSERQVGVAHFDDVFQP